MIASQAWLMGLTWLSKPSPKRRVQFMTEVKCGTHPSPSALLVRSKSRIRGMLRYDTTALITSKIHNARTSRASLISITDDGAVVRCFF